MIIALQLLGMLFWLIDLSGLLYLLNVARDHRGINWHGMPNIIKLSALMSTILLGSALLAVFGRVGWATLVAAGPALIAAMILGFVLAAYLLGNKKF